MQGLDVMSALAFRSLTSRNAPLYPSLPAAPFSSLALARRNAPPYPPTPCSHSPFPRAAHFSQAPFLHLLAWNTLAPLSYQALASFTSSFQFF